MTIFFSGDGNWCNRKIEIILEASPDKAGRILFFFFFFYFFLSSSSSFYLSFIFSFSPFLPHFFLTLYISQTFFLSLFLLPLSFFPSLFLLFFGIHSITAFGLNHNLWAKFNSKSGHNHKKLNICVFFLYFYVLYLFITWTIVYDMPGHSS